MPGDKGPGLAARHKIEIFEAVGRQMREGLSLLPRQRGSRGTAETPYGPRFLLSSLWKKSGSKLRSANIPSSRQKPGPILQMLRSFQQWQHLYRVWKVREAERWTPVFAGVTRESAMAKIFHTLFRGNDR